MKSTSILLVLLVLVLSPKISAQQLERAPRGDLEQQWQWAVDESRLRTSASGLWSSTGQRR